MSRMERKEHSNNEAKKSKGRKARFEASIKAKEEAANSQESLIDRYEEACKEAEDSTPAKKRKKPGKFRTWFTGLKTWKKAMFIVGTTLLVLLVAAAIFVYAYFNGIFGEIYEETPEDYDLSLVDVDGYYNILLLGVDSRDMDNLKGTRSDAIMIVSIHKDTNDVKILSVYRDTYLKIGDTSTYDKITHACVYGGPEMTMKSLNQSLDLNISNYVVVNFKAVADLVDAVGGIEVDVQEYEIQQLNKYTKETANNIGHKKYKLVEAPGVQTLEGVQAVSYGRIRKGVGDDFKRTERMRTVMTLVTDKMKEMSFKDLKKIIKMMTPQVQTNLKKGDIMGLAIRLPQYNIIGTDGWPYDVSTGYIGQVSYVFASDLTSNVIKLHEKFFGQMGYTPSATVGAINGAISQKIEEGKANEGLEVQEPESIDTSQNQGQGNNNAANPKPENPGVEEPSTPPTNPENPGEGGGNTGETPPVNPIVPEEPTNPGEGGSEGGNEGGNVPAPQKQVKPFVSTFEAA